MENPLNTIGDYIHEAMASWQVPGVALAVVRGDEVLHLQGYGVRNTETGEPVTPDTLFAIASSTKAFTSMGAALLVDSGQLEWDAPVRDYLPDFKLNDSYVSEKITVRDLLCHRSGLPRHDLAWYGAGFSREELIKKLAYHKPSKGFREVWQYQNLMYMTAGFLVGRRVGLDWETFTQQRILDPLGMARSCFSAEEMQRRGDYSMPYRINRGKGENEPDQLELMPFYTDTTVGPAGALHSCTSDLANWLKVHLNEGRFNGTPFVSPGNLAQMHQPQMVMPVDGFQAKLLGTSIATYGMGWFVVPYRGYTAIHHGGNIDGFSTMVAFVPQEKIGVAILTNLDSRPLRDILMYEIFDRLLGLPDNQWNPRYHAFWTEYYKAVDQDRSVTAGEQVQGAPLTHPVEAYVGEYAAEGYADFRVRAQGNGLEAWLTGSWYPMQHYHYDIFNVDLERFEMRMPVRFLMNVQGEIDSVSMPIEPQVAPIVFMRKPLVVTDETLAALAGTYDIPLEGIELFVTVKSGKLYMMVTGETEEELVPRRMSDAMIEFQLKGATEIRVEFQKDDQGVYALAVIKQPNMVFKAPRLPA